MWKEFDNNTAIINSIQIEADVQATGIADIEEVVDDEDKAYVRAILVNELRIGRACSPFEIIKSRQNQDTTQ